MEADDQRSKYGEIDKSYGRKRVPSWQLLLKFVFSIAVLSILVAVLDWREVAAIVASARLEALLVAAATLVLGNLCIAWRWQMLLEPVGVHTTFFQSLKSYLKGHFLGFIVPSGMTADVVKALDMNQSRMRGSRSRGYELVASIFVERAFGAFTVGMAVVLGLLISPLAGEFAEMQHVMSLSAIAVVICCIVALFADKFLQLLPDTAVRRWPRIHKGVKSVRSSFDAYRSAPARLVVIMLLSIAIQALRIIPVYVIAVAIGAGEHFFPFLIAVPVIFLLNMVPVVGSRIGTEQGMFVLLLGLAGIGAEPSLVIALLSLVLGLVVSLPGAYWLIRSGKADAGVANGVS